MNVGILGGTFNPPHVGHLIIAEHAREEMKLGRIIFLPSATPPHKQNQDIVEPRHRLEMLRCAVAGNAFFEISEIEIQRGGVSFTVDSLQELENRYPADKLFLLIGMDNLAEFHTWKTPERILEMADLIVMSRPNVDGKQVELGIRERAKFCVVPEIGISSREIRQRIRQGRSIRYLVPPAVDRYIVENGLYKE